MSTSSSPSSAAALLGVELHPNIKRHRTHLPRCSISRSPPTPAPNPQLPIPIPAPGPTIRRREASSALAGFCLARLIDPATFLLAPPALAVSGEPQCSLTTAPSGLAFCDSVVGTGPEATKGQLIKAHYVGRLENGKVFDSSYGRGSPLTFRVGVGEVIKGWDQGILGGDGIPPMLAGGKRTLKLPPELGYGMRGAGCKGGSCIIPPDSTLLFDVEFIGKA